jgi:lipoprotein-anchoring transpeptidase ErfK/SrfK
LNEGDRLRARMCQLRASDERWIEIHLSNQRLIAWEGNKPVYAVIVSTGKPGTPTWPGIFRVQRKLPIDRMRGADYDVPNVPHVMYYYGGYAIHGAYWHQRFGTPVSHGCTNVAPDHARWLFNWADVGTPIVIRP